MDGDQKQKGSRSRVANYQKILATNPRSFIFAQLAEEYIKLGDAENAIAICRKGLEFNPEFSDGLYVLGVALFKKGLRDNARTVFFRILKKQPDHYLALEALRRMGLSDEQIRQAVDETDSAPDGLAADEEMVGLDEALPEETPPPPPAQAATATPPRPQRTSSLRDIRSAYKNGVTVAETEPDDSDRKGLPAWFKIAAPLVLVVLLAASVGGYVLYTRHLDKLAVQAVVDDAQRRLSHDTLAAHTQSIEELERVLQSHPNALPVKALLVELYARLLIDFDPGRLEWQRRMETLVAQFPPDNLNDPRMVSAQAFRAMSLNKLGEVTFMVDTARERRMLTPALLTLQADIHAIDREFDKAIALYDQALSLNQGELRAMYRKGLAQLAKDDISAAKIGLDLLLEQAPDHDRARIGRWESMLYANVSAREIDKELAPFFATKASVLPSIPRARLSYLKAAIDDRVGERTRALDLVRESVKLHPQPESLFLLARIQFDMKQVEQAKQNVQRAIALRPEQRPYHALLGRIFFLEDNKTSALEEMERAIGGSGDDPELLELAGDAAYKLRFYDKAVDYYQRASLIKSQSQELKTKLILTYLDKQDYKDAARRIEQMLTYNVDDPLTHFLNGRMLLSQDKIPAARRAFEKGLSLDSNNREILLEMVRLNVRENDLKSALGVLNRLEQAHPKDTEVLDLLAAWSFEAASWGKARDLYSRLLVLRPQLPFYRLRLAFLDYREGKLVEAKQVVEEELARDPNLGYGHILRGVFLFLEGDPKRAEAQIQKGIQLDSKNPEGHYWLGRVKLDANDVTWAKNEFEITLECQPTHPRAVYEIGVIHFARGQTEQARQRLVSALNAFALFPDTAEYQVKIYLRLGEIAVGRGRVEESKSLFAQANKLDPAAAEPYYYMAREAADKFRNDRGSLALLKKALDLNPAFAPAHFEMGLIHMAKDRNREAHAAFEEYLRLDPRGPYAAEARRYLADHP